MSSGSEDEDDPEDIEYIARRRDRGEDATALPGDGMFGQMEIPDDDEVDVPDHVEEDVPDYDENIGDGDEDELLPDIEPAAETGTVYCSTGIKYSNSFKPLSCNIIIFPVLLSYCT